MEIELAIFSPILMVLEVFLEMRKKVAKCRLIDLSRQFADPKRHTRTDRRIDCHPYNIHHLITWLIWRIFFCCIVCVLQQYFPVDCPIDRILTCGQSLQVIGVTNSENKAFFRRHTVPLMLHSNRCLDFYLFFRKQMSIIFKKTCVSRITHTQTHLDRHFSKSIVFSLAYREY